MAKRPILDAITSPTALIAGGIVAGGLLALGAPAAAVVVAGGGAVGAVGAVRALAGGSVRRGPKRPTVALSSRWQAHVDEAADSYRRYDDAAARVDDPGLREQLDLIGRRLRTGVDTTARIAERGQQLDDAIAALPDPAELTTQMRVLRERGIGHDDARWTSLAYQRDTADRIRRQRDEVLDRLAVLDAQLDAAVVHAIEAGLQSDRSGVRQLGDVVDAAVADLEHLNQALSEVQGLD